MPDLRLLPGARADFADIWRSGAARWGEAQAERYADGIDAALERLRANPLLGVSRDDLAPDLRMLVIRKHVAFYRLDAGTVEVIRILHHGMDATRHLRDT